MHRFQAYKYNVQKERYFASDTLFIHKQITSQKMK
jgi:hypothetical protein